MGLSVLFFSLVAPYCDFGATLVTISLPRQNACRAPLRKASIRRPGPGKLPTGCGEGGTRGSKTVSCRPDWIPVRGVTRTVWYRIRQGFVPHLPACPARNREKKRARNHVPRPRLGIPRMCRQAGILNRRFRGSLPDHLRCARRRGARNSGLPGIQPCHEDIGSRSM